MIYILRRLLKYGLLILMCSYLLGCHQRTEPASLLQSPKFYEAGTAFIQANPEGSITIVEFFDYHCHACYASYPALQNFAQSDPRIRIVLRPIPILGSFSVMAARAALAASLQHAFSPFSNALMNVGPALDTNSIFLIAQHQGIDVQRLQYDMNSNVVSALLGTNMEFARELQINGTPSYLIAQTLFHHHAVAVSQALFVQGAMSFNDFRRAVAKVSA